MDQKISSHESHIDDGWFLSDSGYPLNSTLMTPILSPVTSSQISYNRAFSNTKRTIKYLAYGSVVGVAWINLPEAYAIALK